MGRLITLFKDLYTSEPDFITIEDALERIRLGNSAEEVEKIRTLIDKAAADELKKKLPVLCFSGQFNQRADLGLIEHSGFLILDFDGVENTAEKRSAITALPYVYACWLSPRGNGLKALVRIEDGGKHREHFAALRDIFPDVDKSGVNESRACFESYDPDIYINSNAEPFTGLINRKTNQAKTYDGEPVTNIAEKFGYLLRWLTNKGEAFKSGERNNFIYKFASACCRFGIAKESLIEYCDREFTTDSTFSIVERDNTISSAYNGNAHLFNTAEFKNNDLVEKVSSSVMHVADLNHRIEPESDTLTDIIVADDVKDAILKIYDHGYESVESTGITDLDEYFKFKRGEITLLTGIGNYGKSTILKFLLLMKSILFGDKFALFAPEDNPPEEFYHDLVEMYLGCNCTPYNADRPERSEYIRALDFIKHHFYFIYPKTLSPTPEYIKERFLELIIKHGVTGCVIDPFNQMTNDYYKSGARSDKYLETVLGDFSRFAQINNQYFIIVAHPKMMQKVDGNYPCPDVFDIADGAMWNNKMDNILVYHRPNHQQDPEGHVCELHTKKIRRQKIVGKKGVVSFELNRPKRRYIFSGIDCLHNALVQTGKIKSLAQEMTEYAELRKKLSGR